MMMIIKTKIKTPTAVHLQILQATQKIVQIITNNNNRNLNQICKMMEVTIIIVIIILILILNHITNKIKKTEEGHLVEI